MPNIRRSMMHKGAVTVADIGGTTAFIEEFLTAVDPADAQDMMQVIPGTDVMAYDAGLNSLTTVDGSVGLPYVSGANTWSTAGLGELSIVGGNWYLRRATDSNAGVVTLNQVNGGLGGVAANTEVGPGWLGNIDLNGSNTYSFLTLAGSVYTVNATVTLAALNLTIRDGITLEVAGSPVRVLGTLTMEGVSVISNDGVTPATSSATAQGAKPRATNSRTTNNTYMGGYDGAPPHTLNSNGDAAQALANSVWIGGGGGSGGSGVYSTTTRTGGTGGTGASIVTQKWASHFNGEFTSILLNGVANGTAGRLQIAGGTGGGSGGAAVGSGGLGSPGAGSGGGVLCVCASKGNFSSGSVISAKGGNAGPVNTGGTGNGGSGGSGGGGGGGILFKVGTVTSLQLPTFDVSGGDASNGYYIGGGRGDGGNGADGGRCAVIVGGYAGSVPTIDVSGGAAGNGVGTGASNGTAGTAGTTVFVPL